MTIFWPEPLIQPKTMWPRLASPKKPERTSRGRAILSRCAGIWCSADTPRAGYYELIPGPEDAQTVGLGVSLFVILSQARGAMFVEL